MNVIFTTCTYNHLARAFSLADSVKQFMPGVRFVIGLIDDGVVDSNSDHFTILSAEDLHIPFLQEMCIKYTTLELNSALKPYYADFILNKEDVEQVFYLDSDILLFNPLDEIFSLLNNHSILLSPHSLSTVHRGYQFDDRNFLRSGIYNAGFFAVKKDENGLQFLNWWKLKLKDECFIDAKRGMFAEQLWLNLVPLYFSQVHVVRHLGCNIAYWNLHERTISVTDKGYMVNDCFPLLFFHFSGAGMDCIQKNTLSNHQDKYTFTNRPDVLPLFEQYVAALRKYAYNEYQEYYTISRNFKTKSQPVILIARVSRKILKLLFFRR